MPGCSGALRKSRLKRAHRRPTPNVATGPPVEPELARLSPPRAPEDDEPDDIAVLAVAGVPHATQLVVREEAGALAIPSYRLFLQTFQGL